MPIIRIVGPEADKKTILALIQQVKVWVASVKSLEIDTKHVTPIFVPSVQENPGEKVVFYIEELFTVSFSGRARTTEDRRKLCEAIKKGFNKFILSRKLDVQPKSVTIVIYQVDREKKEYYHWNLSINEISVEIEAPISKVFNYTINPNNTAKWINCIVEESTNEWPVTIGTVYENENVDGQKSEYSLIELEENKVFTLRKNDKNYHVRYSYKELGDSLTKLTYLEWVEEGELEDPFTKDILEKLKTNLEKK